LKSQITPFQNTKPSKHLQTAGFGENMAQQSLGTTNPPLCASELKLEVRQMTQALFEPAWGGAKNHGEE